MPKHPKLTVALAGNLIALAICLRAGTNDAPKVLSPPRIVEVRPLVVLDTYETEGFQVVRNKEFDDFERDHPHELNPYFMFVPDAHQSKVTHYVIGLKSGTNETVLFEIQKP